MKEEKDKMWENDICWCANSDPNYTRLNFCNRTECFRNIKNKPKPKAGERDIFTCSALKDTEDCPYKER